MALLPPRKTKSISSSENISKQAMTPIQILLQMGFPQNRARKALAATGNRGVQLAADWLLAHVNDTTLDYNSCREYIVYACPSGHLMEELQYFWDESASKCGRNGAHNFIPHITLVSFFEAPDEFSDTIVNILKTLTEEIIQQMTINNFNLESYASSNFMGLFLNDQNSDIFKKIAVLFAERVSEVVKVQLDPHLKSLHLTLAYQFDVNHKGTLKSLIKSIINTSSPNFWEIKLYSRESRAINKQVYKVIYAHIPQATDELELRIGDYIYVSKESAESSIDGWAEGISWLTGCSGYFPLCYTERTAESDTWTLHCSFLLKSNSNETSRNINPSKTDKKLVQNLESMFVPVENNSQPDSPKGRNPRKMYICRHGERIDFTFGTWIPYSFDSEGKYIRKDLNMPSDVPQRRDYPNSFQTDTPLTCVGEYQAKLTGWGMKAANLTKDIKHIYCSPSLRCVQTCHNILVGLDIEKQVSICIEPGLFEWLGWYSRSGLPKWMTYEELITAGFNINSNYVPIISLSLLIENMSETIEQYYLRCDTVVQALIKTTENKTGDLLLVAHACSLDSLSRSLLHKLPRSKHNFIKTVKHIPYCGLVALMTDGNNDWSFIEPPVPPLTNSINKRFNWKILYSDFDESSS
ncbi:protein UBASH3A homolog [Daktulosphaira vitifoliae]|uniref:protein UBASH3A homolog n=1 Tax=Daktulosphaira vitifoliae TaxID=58002 RepID=UPI0021AA7B92|nr:protein UBASH3A homolog [Daktulosphaira vitifoliae]